MREAGRKQLIIGLVIAGIGLAISLGSYAAAASSSGGGSYFLLWGLVIVGLVRAFRGWSMMKAAGSAASPAATPSAVPSAPPPMPAMPPQPHAPATSVRPMETEPAKPASTPPPTTPTSMWN
jgi:hypothetical protein